MMPLLDEIFGFPPQIDPQMVAPRRQAAPVPAPRPHPAHAPVFDDGGIGGADVLGAILQGMGGIAAPLGNLVAGQGQRERQNQHRTDVYNWLVTQKDPNDPSRTITPDMAKIIVTNESIAKAYLPRILGTGQEQSTDNATKGLPAGYMWTDQGDPSKGATRVPGIETDPAKDLTPAQKSLDQQFGKDYARFATGGFADMQKGMAAIKDVISDLRAPGSFPNLTGPWTSLVPDSVGAFIAPSSIEARERVEEVVQRNLREILGAQFTQKEGERLIARAYNPALDEETNAKRLDALYASMEKAYNAKMAAAQHFEKHGTLSNYDGSVAITAADIERDMEQNLSGGNDGGSGQQNAGNQRNSSRGGDPGISAQGGSPASSSRQDGARQAPDGNWYVPDPNRPGKYLRVVD